jgi:hypothetical protein
MEFLSDFERIKNLLKSEEITDIEFSENYPTDNNNDDDRYQFETANDTADNNRVQVDIDTGDEYAKKQERGNRRAEALSDETPMEYNIDIMEPIYGSVRRDPIGYDFRHQSGGKDDNLNYLDDYTSSQYNSKKLDTYEKEFFAIFNKAREYRKRVMDVQNRMYGGQEPIEKKKREMNSTVKLMLEMTKRMRESKKYPGIQQKHFMQISKAILDDAKKENGTDKLTKEVEETALDMIKNPETYVKKFQPEQLQGSIGMQDTKDIKSNKRNRNEENMRDQNDKSWRNNNTMPWKNDNSYYSNQGTNLWNNTSENERSNENRYSGDAQDYVNRPDSTSQYYSRNVNNGERKRNFPLY